MSSFNRFDPAGGLKGTLPGGIFEPLLVDQRDLPTMSGRRSLLKSQNKPAAARTPSSSSTIENRELSNFDDIASSRPVPLTALSARTSSRNKGLKNWRPFALDDAGDDTTDDSENSTAFTDATRSKLRSRLSESVSYNADDEENSVRVIAAEHGRASSHSHGIEQSLDVHDEPKRSAWPMDLDAPIQQNPLSCSTGYGASHQSRFFERPQNANLLNSSASYSLWSPMPDEKFAVNGIQKGHYLFPDNHPMPGSFCQVQGPGVYDASRYKVLPRRYHRDPIDTQYPPMLHYSMSQPEYGHLSSYDSIPPKNALFGISRSVSSNLDGSSFVQETPSHATMPTSSRHVSGVNNAPAQVMVADANGYTAGNNERVGKNVEERKLALRNAVLKKIAQDEEELSKEFERERKRVLEQEQEEKNLEQRIKQNSEPSFEVVNLASSPDQSSGFSHDSVQVAASLSGSNHGSAKTEEAIQSKSERKRKALRDAVLAKIEEDQREQEKKFNVGQRQSLRAIRAEKIREPLTHSSGISKAPLEVQEPAHADAAVSPLGRYSQRDRGRDELQGETAKALEITARSQPAAATGRAPRSPPGLPKPACHNPIALSRSSVGDHMTIDTRIKEANNWFYKDGRGENDFRGQVMEIANEYALESEQKGDDAYYSKEGKEFPKQMTLLIGNVVANLKSYITDEKDDKPDYFANFEPVRHEFREIRTEDVCSYFEDPTHVKSNSPSGGRSHSTSGKKALVNRSS